MKKIRVVLGIAMAITLVMFSSCKNEDATVSEVSASDVIDLADEFGIDLGESKPVASKSVFTDNVISELTEEISEIFSDSNLLSFDMGLKKNVKGNGDASRAVIKESDLKESFEDLEKQIDAISEAMEAGGKAEWELDWSAPEGEIDSSVLGEDFAGLTYEISDLSIYAKFAGEMSNIANIDIDTKGSASADVSLTLNGKKFFNTSSPVIPALKGNVAANASAKAAVSISDEEISASADAYYGLSYAVLFNTSNYNGIITLDLELDADVDVDEDNIEDFVSLATKIGTATDYTKLDFDEILETFGGSISLKISVYDINGEKQFDLIDSDSASEIAKEILSVID